MVLLVTLKRNTMKVSRLKEKLILLGIGEGKAESILSTASSYQDVIDQVRDWLHMIDAPVEPKLTQLKNFIRNEK